MNQFLTLMKSEWMVTLIIFLLLFIKIGKGMRNDSLLSLIQVLLLLNVILSFVYNQPGVLFDRMFQTTPLIALQKAVLSLGVYLISLLFSDWFKKTDNLAEFFILLLSALLGMFLLISSGNLLIFFLALELATIPLAAMANFDLHKKASSEAAMKMILSSAFSSGLLLLGISFVYGATGTIQFSELPQQLESSPLLVLAFVLLFAAFGFKLSVVPFHLWTADVYEGSPMATTAFLSVTSKGAIAFIFASALYKVFQPFHETWYVLLIVLSISTMVIGNLFAIRQKNIKRFLAFSSIAQVGFILVGMSSNGVPGTASILYFVLIYTFSNLAAFGVAAVVSERTGKESIPDFKGFYQTNPFLSWVMTISLFSLAGIPPTAGFFGKLFLLASGASKGNYLFITLAALNMVVSLYYYLRIVRTIFMEKNDTPIEKIPVSRTVALGLIICTAAMVLLGLFSWVFDYVSSISGRP